MNNSPLYIHGAMSCAKQMAVVALKIDKWIKEKCSCGKNIFTAAKKRNSEVNVSEMS